MRDNHKLMLIHAVKAIRYRFNVATKGSKEGFGSFKIGADTRTPNEILNHMYDLAAKTRLMVLEGHFRIAAPELLDFTGESARFLEGLEDLLVVLQEIYVDIETCEKLLQGPVLDIATHVGQLAMLNGLYGNKIPGESYYDAIV